MSRLLALPSGRYARWIVAAVWVAILAGSGAANLPGKFTEAEDNESTSFLPGDAESTAALKATERLQDGELAPVVIVYRREGGLTSGDRAHIARDVRKLTAKRFRGVVRDAARAAGASSGPTSAAGGVSPGAPAAGPDAGAEATPRPAPGQPPGYQAFLGPIPAEDGSAALLIGYVEGDGEADTILDPVQHWRDAVSDPGGGLEVKVTGPAGYAADAIEIFESINGTLLLAASGLVFFLLICIYRSPVFFAIPMAAVLFAEMLSRSLGYGLSELGVTINGQSSAIMSVLVLGAGTDYALLLAARYREELHFDDDHRAALSRALRSAGPAIVASGVTVIAALLCLSLAKVNGTSGLGPIGALGVACAMLAMLTVLPAMLAIFGRRAFWPFVPHTPSTVPAGEGMPAPARTVLEGPRQVALGWALAATAIVLVTLPLMLVLTLGARIAGLVARRRLRNPLFGLLDDHVFRPYELRRARHEHLADETHGAWRRIGEWVARTPRRVLAGAAGILVVLSLGLAAYSDDLTTADAYTEKVESVEGQELISESFPAGANAPTDVVVTDPAKAPAVAAALRRVEGVAAVTPSVRDDEGVLLQATLEPDPYSTEAFALVEPMRRAVRAVAGDDALVGGPSAVEHDVREASERDTLVIPPVVLVVVALILVILLRALLAPLLLIATVVLSFAAALGVGFVVFDVVFGFPGTDPGLPLFAFVFLVALGIDYNIFLMARVREEAQRYGTRHGTIRGLAVTGGVITSAGIVLAGTFSVLAVLPLVFLTEIGFIVAFGVLLDTFLVRSLLVPALTLTLGPRVWWPSKLADPEADARRDAVREDERSVAHRRDGPAAAQPAST